MLIYANGYYIYIRLLKELKIIKDSKLRQVKVTL
jgi:hypothetical protein